VQVLQVGKFIQLTSTFFGGFTIAIIRGWLLAIVLCSAIPLLAIAGAMVALVISKMASRGQSAYAKAANVVEQTIGGIKTVSRFVKRKYSRKRLIGFSLKILQQKNDFCHCFQCRLHHLQGRRKLLQVTTNFL
jgi:ABC-type multidrug transport system fused ATPase/permease subunit